VVERGRGVVEVINEDDGETESDTSCTKDGQLKDFDGDGDVRCGDPTVLNHQHNPQWLGSGAVLVADSENDRIVELHRVEDGSWQPVWSVEKAGGVALDWPRDADRLPNGNTLITDSLNKRVVEVDETGKAVGGIGTGSDIPYEADRLPGDEYTGPYMSAAESNSEQRVPIATETGRISESNTASEVPILTLVITGLRGTFDWIPYWFAERHLLVALVSVVFVITGCIDMRRSRR
jgi:hypothetical protein